MASGEKSGSSCACVVFYSRIHWSSCLLAAHPVVPGVRSYRVRVVSSWFLRTRMRFDSAPTVFWNHSWVVMSVAPYGGGCLRIDGNVEKTWIIAV